MRARPEVGVLPGLAIQPVWAERGGKAVRIVRAIHRPVRGEGIQLDGRGGVEVAGGGEGVVMAAGRMGPGEGHGDDMIPRGAGQGGAGGVGRLWSLLRRASRTARSSSVTNAARLPFLRGDEGWWIFSKS